MKVKFFLAFLVLTIVAALMRMGPEDTAYVTRWALAPAGPQSALGCVAAKGEFFVTGIQNAKFSTWMNQVGKDTVGLVLKAVL